MNNYNNKIISSKENLKNVNIILNKLKIENNNISKQILEDTIIYNYTEELKKIKILDKKNEISKSVTDALNLIYPDNYEFIIDEEKENISLIKNGVEIFEGTGYLQDSSGGGVLSIISFILKIIISIFNYGIKFFIYDENFSEIHKDYLPKLSQYLYSLSKTYDVIIVLITHSPELSEYSNLNYKLVSKNNKLIIDNEEEINIDKSKLYYQYNIKNFQSIEYIELFFQGFTIIEGVNDIGKSAIVKSLLSLLNSDWKKNYTSNFIKDKETSYMEIQSNNFNNDLLFSLEVYKGKYNYNLSYNGSNETFSKKMDRKTIKNKLPEEHFQFIENVKENSDKLLLLNIDSQFNDLFFVEGKDKTRDTILNLLFGVPHLNELQNKCLFDIKKSKTNLKINNANILLFENKKNKIIKIIEQIENIVILNNLNIKLSKYLISMNINKFNLIKKNKLIKLRQILFINHIYNTKKLLVNKINIVEKILIKKNNLKKILKKLNLKNNLKKDNYILLMKLQKNQKSVQYNSFNISTYKNKLSTNKIIIKKNIKVREKTQDLNGKNLINNNKINIINKLNENNNMLQILKRNIKKNLFKIDNNNKILKKISKISIILENIFQIKNNLIVKKEKLMVINKLSNKIIILKKKNYINSKINDDLSNILEKNHISNNNLKKILILKKIMIVLNKKKIQRNNYFIEKDYLVTMVKYRKLLFKQEKIEFTLNYLKNKLL